MNTNCGSSIFIVIYPGVAADEYFAQTAIFAGGVSYFLSYCGY